jgi:hypothetical protein
MTRTTSASGQTLPKWAVNAMSGLPPIATELRTSLMVRFVPIGGPRSAAFSTLWLDSRKIRTAVLLERYADEAG